MVENGISVFCLCFPIQLITSRLLIHLYEVPQKNSLRVQRACEKRNRDYLYWKQSYTECAKVL